MAILGEGQPPIEEVDLTDKQEGNGLYIWGAVVIAIGIVLFFVFKRRTRSNS